MTAAVLANDKLTAEELDQARLFLQDTQNSVAGATKGLSEAQWNFRPSPDRWSIAENMAHMVMVQELVLERIQHQLANAPAPPADLDCKLVDAIVINHFPNRLARFSAPEIVRPVGRIEPVEVMKRLMTNYERLTECLESTPGLRQHMLDSPPLKAVSKGVYVAMDGYQWILTAAAHTERHTKQILEVMADPGYPV